jgi:hypothetical protein
MVGMESYCKWFDNISYLCLAVILDVKYSVLLFGRVDVRCVRVYTFKNEETECLFQFIWQLE